MSGYHPHIQTAGVALCALLLICLFPAKNGYAQAELDRISVSERSDGQGYVVRYHLSERVDSFRVIQPEVDLIQMKLYAESLDTTSLNLPNPGGAVQSVELFKQESGFGINLHLTNHRYFLANAYPDRSGNDLLLALTFSEEQNVAERANRIDPVNWQTLAEYEEDGSGGFTGYLQDEGYLQIRENLNFDTIVIDPGHGGRDPGTIGHGGLREKDVTLAIALKLGEYIEEYMPDVEVIYTRNDDTFVELEERGSIANRAQGDLFVSIHANSFRPNPRVQGAEIYFLGLARTQSALETMKRENSVVRLENGNEMDELTEEDLLIYELANAGNLMISERIAGMMEQQFRERAQRRSRGVKQAQFLVLYHASMPAVLVEAGFITNPDEARYLNSEYGQAIIASAIFRAIRDYKNDYERSRSLTRSD